MEQFIIRIKTIICAVLILSGLAIPVEIFGQGKFSVTGGFSTAEFLNIGVKYRIMQSQIGLSSGFIPAYSYQSFTVSGNFSYHFGGSSKFSDLHPWYGKSGLLYIVDEDAYLLDKGLYLPIQIGRNFNISNKIGINFELGLEFLLTNDRTIKKMSNAEFGVSEASSFPCFGIGCFYRL